LGGGGAVAMGGMGVVSGAGAALATGVMGAVKTGARRQAAHLLGSSSSPAMIAHMW